MGLILGCVNSSCRYCYPISERIRFEVWSPVQQRWRRAWCAPGAVERNFNLMESYGLKVRLYTYQVS